MAKLSEHWQLTSRNYEFNEDMNALALIVFPTEIHNSKSEDLKTVQSRTSHAVILKIG